MNLERKDSNRDESRRKGLDFYTIFVTPGPMSVLGVQPPPYFYRFLGLSLDAGW